MSDRLRRLVGAHAPLEVCWHVLEHGDDLELIEDGDGVTHWASDDLVVTYDLRNARLWWSWGDGPPEYAELVRVVEHEPGGGWPDVPG